MKIVKGSHYDNLSVELEVAKVRIGLKSQDSIISMNTTMEFLHIAKGSLACTTLKDVVGLPL